MNALHEKALALAAKRYLPNSVFNKVMVKEAGCGRMRGLTLHKNKDGDLYVRVGRRGSCRVLLKDMRRADVIEATQTPIFYE